MDFSFYFFFTSKINYSVAIIGPTEEILGFSAAGVKIFPAKNEKDAFNILMQIKKDNLNENVDKKFAIVFVIEEILVKISEDDYQKISSGALPAIIPLSGNNSSAKYGLKKINKLV